MTNLSKMVWIELRKAFRSRIPFFTALGSLFMPLGIAFLIFLARNPEISQKLGLVSAKANLVVYSLTDWASYLSLSAQIVAAGGFFLFTFANSWVFGREFSDGTLKDILAVPVHRSTILLAKFIVVAVWSIILSVLILALSLVLGGIIGLPQVSLGTILHGSLLFGLTAGLVIVTVLPFAFFASVGRGYLLPLAVAILSLILANLVAVMGLGAYFPWSVPGMFAQGKGAMLAVSYWIVALTGLIGMGATYFWWKYADQNR